MLFVKEITSRFSGIRLKSDTISFQYATSWYPVSEVERNHIVYGSGHKISGDHFKIYDVTIRRRIVGPNIKAVLKDSGP